MSVFLDTCVFVAAKLEKDKDHQKAVKILENALKNDFGKIYTSDYIFDETVTLLLMRTKTNKIIRDFGNSILSSPNIEIIKIDDNLFEKAWQEFGKYKDKLLSFTDCTTIAIIMEFKIDKIISFDNHFDGIVNRIKE